MPYNNANDTNSIFALINRLRDPTSRTSTREPGPCSFTFPVAASVHPRPNPTMDVNRTLAKQRASGSGSRSAAGRVKTGHRRPSSKNGRHRPSAAGRRRDPRLAVPERNDLDDIEQEIAAVEGRIQEIMQNLQTDIVNAASFMSDSIGLWTASILDETRHSLNALQALRESNQKTAALSQRIHDV